MAINILVIGGAGYIGSHMVKLLASRGCSVTTLDDLSSGHRDSILHGDFIEGNFGDEEVLDSVLSKGFDAVMHFASFIQVGESIDCPDKYYQNNFVFTKRLLDAMRKHGVDKIIFSSTAATYGEPQRVPIGEDHPQSPINPYGRSKLMVEWLLSDYARDEHPDGRRYQTLDGQA